MRIQIIVALIAFLLLRLSRAALDATVPPLAFATVVKANLMHRRCIRELLACQTRCRDGAARNRRCCRGRSEPESRGPSPAMTGMGLFRGHRDAG